MFGGITPAAQALGRSLVGLVNPATLSAGAFAALAAAYYKGATELDEFQKNSIMTGNALGLTVGRVAEMSREMSKMSDATKGEAAAALTEVAKSGKIASDQIEAVATVAARSAQLLGRETSEVVQEFASLADKPAEAAVKLNEKYHFLTAAVYEQVSALEAQGRAQEATALAQEEFARVSIERLNEVQERLGYFERGWNAITGAIKSAGSAMANFGRQQTIQDLLAENQKAINAARATISGQATIRSGQGRDDNATAKQAAQNRIDYLEKQQEFLLAQAQTENSIALARANDAKDQQAGIDAQAHINKLLADGATKAEKMAAALADFRKEQDAIRRVNPNSPLLSAENVAKAEAAIRERYKDKSGGPKNDAATRMLMSLREQEASLRAQVDSSEKLTSSQAALAKFEQQIADLKTKQTLTADEKSILAAQDKLRAQLQINVAVEREAEARKSLVALEQRSEQIAAQMASSRQSTNEQYQRMLDSFGLGDKATERVEAQKSIYREFKKYQDDLAKIAAKGGTLDSDEYKRGTAEIQAELQRRLAMQKSYYDTVDQMQSSWSLGASHGLANYADEAGNAFKGMESLATKSFQGMEDAWVDFAMTGKASFSDLANSVIADLMRIAIRQSVLGPLAGALGGALSGIFGGTPMTSTPYGDVGTGGWYTYSAKGNVFSGPGISAYSNQIVDRPTFFAKGGNVMGEAGPEAIMPLKRGPDGRLGVSTHGGGVAPNVAINLINQGGEQMQATQQGQPRFNGEQWVIDVVMTKVMRNRSIRNQLRSALTT